MSNLLLRAITGVIFVAMIILSIAFSVPATIVVFTMFFILGTVEYFKLFKENKVIQLKWGAPTFVAILIYGLLVADLILGLNDKVIGAIIVPVVLLLMLTELWRKKTNPLVNLGIQLFGFLYLLIPFYLLINMRISSESSVFLLIGMFTLIWSNDTFAYLSGRMLGKTKLFERISPKKTWEGTIGGIVITVIISYFIGILDHSNGVLFWVISALIIVPGAIFGDLLESLFKRSLNIKDSGTILPGHGGILDRFDAALFTIPFFYCWWVIYSYF
jgi:phosphatidate cytidylyltransferase